MKRSWSFRRKFSFECLQRSSKIEVVEVKDKRSSLIRSFSGICLIHAGEDRSTDLLWSPWRRLLPPCYELWVGLVITLTSDGFRWSREGLRFNRGLIYSTYSLYLVIARLVIHLPIPFIVSYPRFIITTIFFTSIEIKLPEKWHCVYHFDIFSLSQPLLWTMTQPSLFCCCAVCILDEL